MELRGICTKPLCMLMDFFPLGSMDSYLHTSKKGKIFSWRYRLKVALSIAYGMEYLHSEDFIHRDLRSPNILLASLDENQAIPVAKVADFGLAVVCAKGMSGGDFNECWTAPEILRGEPYTEKVDMYSFAIVCWELLQQGFPFYEYSERFAGKPRLDFFAAIGEGLRPSIPVGTPAPYVDLLNDCWTLDPNDRPTFAHLAERIEAMLLEVDTWTPAEKFIPLAQNALPVTEKEKEPAEESGQESSTNSE